VDFYDGIEVFIYFYFWVLVGLLSVWGYPSIVDWFAAFCSSLSRVKCTAEGIKAFFIIFTKSIFSHLNEPPQL